MNRDQLIRQIAASSDTPSNKRKALALLGVESEYLPHQGKKEMARRVKKMQVKSIGSA